METFRIDILNPKVKNLLKELADLKLIRIKPDSKSDFSDLINNLRMKSNMNLSIDDITKEVEDVRKSRYEK